MAKDRDARSAPPRQSPAGAKTDALLREVVAALSSSLGERFFRELVLNLSRILGVDYAFVGEVAPDRPDTIRTLAFCNHGRIAGNIDYRLETGTPCGDVACREVCYFPDDAQKLFPEDDLILRYGVEAFIGHPLLDAAGNVRGLLAAMHERPIPEKEHIQSVLQICAGRAAAELERARIEAALRASEARLKEAQRIARLGSWELDLAKNELKWSDEIYRVFELDPKAFGASYEAFLDVVHPDDREAVNRAYADSVRRRTSYDIVHRLLLPDGRVKHVHERGESYYDPAGRPLRSLGTVQDVTERVLAEQALARSEGNFRALTENANVGILVNHDGRHVFANDRVLEMLGYTRDELYATGVKELVHAEEYAKVAQRLRERMATQEQLQHLAHHDALTELPNRTLFFDRLKQTLARARRHGRTFAVLFLDLDGFKHINDVHDHEAGDRFLKGVAARLRTAIRVSDTVARFGGDEFAFVVDDLPQATDLAAVAANIRQAFAAPIALAEGEFPVGASIGVSFYPDDGADADALLKRADAAMYRAKGLGEGGVRFHPPL